ncbi:hypothetical protein ACE4RR_13285 [Alteribacillus sp. HJP-4]
MEILRAAREIRAKRWKPARMSGNQTLVGEIEALRWKSGSEA